MKPLVLLVIVANILLLQGCSLLQPDVDQLDAMIPATEEPAEGANVPGEDLPDVEPQPQTPTEVSLWQRIRDGFALPNIDNKRIDAERQRYVDNPDYVDVLGKRARRYLYYITQQAEKRHIPLEFTLLPIVESAFDPFAYSSGHASGPWQFIPSTARYFNLKLNWWYDGRRDILASTNAALTYLQRLANRFDGDWLLALASYNAGGGTVSRAIKRNKRRGLPTDFWHLDLPRETTQYVPRLLAVAQVIAHPEKYGITLPPIANKPYFKVVKTQGQMDLSLAAEMAGISIKELSLLNPGYNRWATPPNGPNRLLIPVNHVKQFKVALNKLPADKRITWQRYIIQPGDSLIAISKHTGVPVNTIRRINKLDNSRIIAGHTLLVPGGLDGKDDYASSLAKTLRAHDQPSGGRLTQYTVHSGDSLWLIAQRFGVSLHDLLAWNGLSKRSVLHPGQSLRLYNAASYQKAKPRHYTIESGDSLWSIAQRYDVDVKQLMAWNNLSKNSLLHPGQTLRFYTQGDYTQQASKPAKIVGSHYTVKSGDSLWSIAQRHNMTVDHLVAINGLNENSILQPGQILLTQKASASSNDKKTVQYSVQKGDSLYAIASLFIVCVSALQSWNNIDSNNTIYPGQALTLHLDAGT